MCDGNKMKEVSKNLYEYRRNPKEKGTWMQKITETKKNCATKKVILHRDCLTCPVMSPFGVLTNKTEVTTVITRDVTITWEDPILQKDEKCKLKKVISATGVKTKQDDGSFKLIDELNQLEFHYEERPYDFCNHTFFKLSNLRNAYIELPKIADQQAMLLFNRQHGMCLSYKTLKLVQCQPVEEQWYKLSQTMVILSFKDPSSCMGFIDYKLQHTSKQCIMERYPYYKPWPIPLIWNPKTKQITNGMHCLEAYKDLRVEEVNFSDSKTNQ
jgi:hypothetical protein